MMRICLLAICMSFGIAVVSAAQDRIYIKAGRVIECKVIDSKNRDREVFFYPADDPQTSHFIPTNQIEFIELGSQRIVRTPTDKLEPAKIEFSIKAPSQPHMVGVGFDFFSNADVLNAKGLSISHAYFFDHANGIFPEIFYRKLNRSDDSFGLIPITNTAFMSSGQVRSSTPGAERARAIINFPV